MYIDEYCIRQGMDFKQLVEYLSKIKVIARDIVSHITNNFSIENGMYYDSSEILGEYKEYEREFIIF